MEHARQQRPVTYGRVNQQRIEGASRLTDTSHSSGTRLSRHEHERAAFTLVLHGSFVESVGRTEYRCDPGTLLFKPAGARHANEYSASGARSFIVDVGPTVLARLSPFFDLSGQVVFTRQGIPAALTVRLCHAFWRHEPGLEMRIEEVLGELSCGRRHAHGRERVRSAWLLRVEERLRAGWRGDTTLADLAEAEGVHPVYMARAFRSAFGCSPASYFDRCRVDAAVQALMCGGRPLADLASRLGYSDQSHLGRHFKRRVGDSPGRFARSWRCFRHGFG